MARIEELVASIQDERLRKEIASELKKLKMSRKFGLVFEEHLPETIRLPQIPVKVGETVVRNSGSNQDLWVVEGKRGAKLELRSLSGSETAEIETNAVVVARRFGEPIYPALIPIDRAIRQPGKTSHVLIEADNYHALQALLYCYEGKVDLIYIDPPYNTGARDWRYNNDYVDSADSWRHSKWLAMMKRRLILAKRLLKPKDGVIIVTIDEHELHHLGVLLSEIFPEHHRQMVSIVINPKGVAQGRFSRVEEHALYCFGPKAMVAPGDDDLLTPEEEDEAAGGLPRWYSLLRSGTDAQREDNPTLFYPVYIDELRKAVVDAGDPIPLEETPKFGAKRSGRFCAWPVRKDGSLGRWMLKKETLLDLIRKGYVALGEFDGKRGTYGISYLGKKHMAQLAAGRLRITGRDETRNVVTIEYAEAEGRQPRTVWHRSSHDAGAYGSDLIKKILGRRRAFPFPKSVYAVKDSISAVLRERPQALVLDFFAGSGTTLHAVAMLNQSLGGQRRCILVTNNEVDETQSKALEARGLRPGMDGYDAEGICQAVTWPRCKFAITGKNEDGPLLGDYIGGSPMAEGYQENVEYFRLSFLDPATVARGEALGAILPMLWLIAGAKGEIPSIAKGPWLVSPGGSFAVLLDERKFPQFLREIEGLSLSHIFLVTDSEDSFRDMAERLPDSDVRMLYRSYLENFRINLGEGAL